MKPILKNWEGKVTVDGSEYNSITDVNFSDMKGSFRILLHPKQLKAVNERQRTSETHVTALTSGAPERTGEIKIKVKPYMTKPGTPEFDFMTKWNNDIPMPLVEMAGVKLKETRGMVYMKLHGLAEPVITCRRCGKTLTNPVSRKYGIGPECMSKLGFAFDIDDIDNITEALVNVEWEGWIIKSAILEEEDI